MKTLEQWFSEYEVSHKNPINKAIHYVCVPTIYFSIVGLLMSIPRTGLINFIGFNQPTIANWATVILFFVMVFYARLSITMAIKIGVFSVICLIWNNYISHYFSLLSFSITIFVAAWIGQFYGHNVEGKKPSFLKDIQFLLIGPAWVIDNLFSKTKR